MALKKIPLNNLAGLKKFNDDSGQGTIYITSNNKLVKIYSYDDAKNATKASQRLEAIGRDEKMYSGLEHFCAVPEALITSPLNNQVIGFIMSHFQGFESLGMLRDIMFCIEKKITIRNVITTFLNLHESLNQIHNKGFVVGDFNEDNAMFKLVDKKAILAFVDVDSWAVRKSNLTLPPTAKTATFCHPEIETNPANLKPYHDWYSYTVLMARSLIKNDPFNLGIFDVRSIAGATRQAKGITCWDPRVTLAKEDEIYTKRFGIKLTSALQTWLKGDQLLMFPKRALQDFLDGLAFCTNCGLEVHIDHVNCTKCKAKLDTPTKPFTKKTPPIPTNNMIINSLIEIGG